MFNTCSCDVKNLNNLLCRLAAASILLSSWARESNHQILILTLPHFPKNKLFMKYFGIKISSFDWKLWSFMCALSFFFWWRSWYTWLAATFPPKHAYYIYWLPSRTPKTVSMIHKYYEFILLLHEGQWWSRNFLEHDRKFAIWVILQAITLTI